MDCCFKKLVPNSSENTIIIPPTGSLKINQYFTFFS